MAAQALWREPVRKSGSFLGWGGLLMRSIGGELKISRRVVGTLVCVTKPERNRVPADFIRHSSIYAALFAELSTDRLSHFARAHGGWIVAPILQVVGNRLAFGNHISHRFFQPRRRVGLAQVLEHQHA